MEILQETYTGTVKNTNKKAHYRVNDSRGTCKRVSPIYFTYVIPDAEEMTNEIRVGNLKMLEGLLRKKSIIGKVNKRKCTISKGRLLFSSTEEGIVVENERTSERVVLNSYSEIVQYVEKYRDALKSEKSVVSAKSKQSMRSNPVKEKAIFDKYKHLLT